MMGDGRRRKGGFSWRGRMGRVAAFLALALFMLSVPLPGREASVPEWRQVRPEDREITAKVIRVADGDTIDVRDKRGTVTRIRIYGLDAPEASQEFGAESRRYAVRLLLKQEVRVLGQNRDQYGRLVGKVFLKGRDYSLDMIRNGMAWCYEQYCDDPGYREAQEAARREGRGLWAVERRGGGAPVPPWEYRRSHPRREKKAAEKVEKKHEASPRKQKEKKGREKGGPSKSRKEKKKGKGEPSWKVPGGRISPLPSSGGEVRVRPLDALR